MNRGRERKYRGLVSPRGLVAFQVAVKETDLLVAAPNDLSGPARTSILTHRRYIEERIESSPEFLTSLEPLAPGPAADDLAPAVIREMLAGSRSAGTGPMAAVAGAVAHLVGLDLLAVQESEDRDRPAEIIVENGGDLFLATERELTVAVLAGNSSLSRKIGLRLPASAQPAGLSTSSGTVGHSLSLGRADAAVVLSKNPARSDALATALGNRVGSKREIKEALEWLAQIPGVEGGLVIVGDELGAWGGLEMVRL